MIKEIRKRLLSVLMTLAMVVSLLPALTISARAAGTLVTFEEGSPEDRDYLSEEPFARTISDVTFTFTPGSSAYTAQVGGCDIHRYNDIGMIGIYALSARASGSGVDFTVSAQTGYTFDLTGFKFTATTGSVTVYYNGMVSNQTYSDIPDTIITKSGLTGEYDGTDLTVASL